MNIKPRALQGAIYPVTINTPFKVLLLARFPRAAGGS